MMNHLNQSLPQVGTWITREGLDGPGVVEKVTPNHNGKEVLVRWLKSKKVEWERANKLRCGFFIGMEVQDVPLSRTRVTLGEGVVLERRRIGNRDQVLVEFPERGECLWLPYQNLKQIKGVQQRFELGQTGSAGNAERFRLRCLAHAIEMWNENTGSLSRLDIDPLPHQIHLVHHILASGNLNWLIADDVGLGKTIEVGMLLSALNRRKAFRRILVIAPAGLVKQWKDELHYKFGMSDFYIYGEDFQINEVRNWKLYEHVIGSIDRFKSEKHLSKLMQAGTWDIVVFDEAHRLSRTQPGMHFKTTERFRLASALRKKTDAIILLTATPHQGKQDKFHALLEIIRPEFKEEIRRLVLNPQILRRMVIRNNKADVTDSEGNFVFKGKITTAVKVNIGEEEKEFHKNLLRYLREGYAAGEKNSGKVGRTIGFVMNIYRKLAASSLAAIERALARRLTRLRKDANSGIKDPDAREGTDERYLGEWEESFDSSNKEFFAGEIPMLKSLLLKLRQLLDADRKIESFLNDLLPSVLHDNPKEKVVIFTEYRATQEHIAHTLRNRFGQSSVSLIHGSQQHGERFKAIAEFEDIGQFLISTEAGGEGINLHRRCHIMVNYDLPWNPMRLVQRVGRLYRYGQKKKVIVINIHSPQTMDGQILDLLYHRIEQVVQDMSVLGGEFRPGLEAEILGEIADALDIEDVLERAAHLSIKHTRESIEDALKRAQEAVEKQRELLEFASGYDPEEAKGELKISQEHVRSFIEGMFKQLGVEIVETTHKGEVMRIHLPEKLAGDLLLKGRHIRITLNRDIAATRPDIHMMDLDFMLLQYLISRAKSYGFDGRVAKLRNIDASAIVTSILRWQNDQGMRMRQEFAAFIITKAGMVETNPEVFSQWLLEYAKDGDFVGDRKQARNHINIAISAMDQRLSEISNIDIHPENRQLICAGWSS